MITELLQAKNFSRTLNTESAECIVIKSMKYFHKLANKGLEDEQLATIMQKRCERLNTLYKLSQPGTLIKPSYKYVKSLFGYNWKEKTATIFDLYTIHNLEKKVLIPVSRFGTNKQIVPFSLLNFGLKHCG